jgi:MFS family permease
VTRVWLSVARTFAALRSPNYRLWYAGQLVSLIGSWMQTTAQGFLVFELTRSPAYLGVVGFAAGLPSWLFMLYGGVIADRVSRRTLLVITQAAMMVLAFLLAGLVATGAIRPWQVVLIAFALGVANAFDAPARQSFVVELVDREDLTNAIALNSTMFNSAVVIGPAVGAAVYAALGPAWCFTINGLSFIAVILALLRMRIGTQPMPVRLGSAVAEAREGLRYVVTRPVVRALIANLGVLGLFGISVMTLMPAWAVNVLGGDVRTNGWLLSARGLGAVIGALFVAWLGRRAVRGRVWTAGGLLMPLALAVFALSRWTPLSLAAMMGVGFCFMTQANTANSIVQTRIDDHMRGRVMGIYTLVFFGSMPLGSLLVGAVAARLGEPATVLIGAGILAVVAVAMWVRLPYMRSVP